MAGTRRSYSPPLPPQAVFKHSKVTLHVRPDRTLYVAGQSINGVLELACSSEKVWLGRIGLELRGAEQLQSLDHAASQTFLNAEVSFQSASLPPSNAVLSTSPSLSGYWPARKGVTRFPFSFPIPASCPTSCRFGGNASIAYHLSGTVQVQNTDSSGQGERQILTKRLEVAVVERWTDWHAERFHEPSEAQRRERVGGGLLGGPEGNIWIDAIIPDRLFYRGYELPEEQGGGPEKELSRGQIAIQLSVKNCTTKTLSGVKVSLHRRLKILPAEAGAGGASVPKPRITEDVQVRSFSGREWEFPPAGQERIVTCFVDVPKQDRFLSIRKSRLFEVHPLVKVMLDMGTLTKDIILELPIWVAHYASLPKEAFFKQPTLSHQLHPLGRSQSPFSAPRRPHSAAPCAVSPMQITQPPTQHAGYAHPGYFPPASPQPHLQSPPDWQTYQNTGRYSPSIPQHFSPPASPGHALPNFISFDPTAPDLTQSRFFAHLGQSAPPSSAPYHAPQQQQAYQQMPASPIASPARPSSAMSYAGTQWQPNTIRFLQQQNVLPPMQGQHAQAQTGGPTSYGRSDSAPAGSMPRSSSANPYLQSSPSRMTSPQRALSPVLREALTAEEQARVLLNARPASYDVAERAYTLRDRQHALQQQAQASPSGSPRNDARASRRQSMPPPAPSVALFDAPAASRPSRTPPLAPSSRFATPPQQSSSPFTADELRTLNSATGGIAGLPTIGEDGESQAGTLRIKGTLPRSSSQVSIVQSVKALHAVGSSVDEEGNTSVSLLEELVEQRDREKERESVKASGLGAGGSILAEMDTDKSLPRPPVPSDKGPAASTATLPSEAKVTLFNMFSGAPSTPTTANANLRRASQPLAPVAIPPKPIIRPSQSDSLLALESRLSRPSSPISPTSPLPPIAAAFALAPKTSPPLRSSTTSPVQRGLSPVHVGNAGALRKKSSQISLRRKKPPRVDDETKALPVSTSKAVERVSGGANAPEVAASVQRNLGPASKRLADSEVSSSPRVVSKASNADRHINTVTKEPMSRATASAASRAEAAAIGSETPRKLPGKTVSSTVKTVRTPTTARTTLAVSDTKTSAATIRSGRNSPSKPSLSPIAASPASMRAITGAPPRSPATPSKRYASDPQGSSSSPALADKTNGATSSAASRRISLESAPPPSLGLSQDKDKFGSARGGRGGLVTDVAKQWATLIAAGESSDVVVVPIAAQKKVARPGVGAATFDKGPIVPSKLASASSNGKAGISKNLSAPATAPAAVSAPPKAPMPNFARQQPGKAAPARTFVNSTMGKPAVFAKRYPPEAASMAEVVQPKKPVPGRTVSDPPTPPAAEIALGPGALKLRALIDKFS